MKEKESYLENKKFWQELNKIKKNKVVEIGCGSGYLAEKIQKKYNLDKNNFLLSDIEDFRSVAKDFPFKKVDINFHKLPLKNDSQDLVISMFVLEHVENAFNLLREADRVLKPCGMMLIAFPNGWNIISRILFLFRCRVERWHRDGSNHITFLPKNVFFRLFKNYKKVASVGKHSYFFERIAYAFMPDIRGRFNLLYKFKIKLPANEFFSDEIIYFFKKSN